MANGFSDYLEGAILDFYFKRTTTPFATAPTTVYVSLHSGDPGDTGASELSTGTGSYARASITTDTNNSTNTQFNAKGTSGAASTITNKATITFPTATANWAAATFFGIWDASTAGNLIFTGTITGGVQVNNGNTLSLVDGNITISID